MLIISITFQSEKERKKMKVLKKEVSGRSVPNIADVRREKELGEIHSFVAEYDKLMQEERVLKKRKTELAGIIKAYAVMNGSKDDKGSYYCENDNYVFGRQSSTSVVERSNIIDVLESKGLNSCIDTVKVVNRSMLDKLHDEGAITNADLEEMFEVRENPPRVFVRAKEVAEDMPEVKVTRVARKKGRK